MFGYACDETPALMPFPIYYAHRLVQRQSEVRRDGRLPWLRPGREIAGHRPLRRRQAEERRHGRAVDAASPEHERAPEGARRSASIEEIIKPVFPRDMLAGTRFLVNPTGRFEIGGPHGDAGVTGRKIIVDTYGGAAPHGGGAFSGKDPSKVDRSAAYAARYVAKNIVAAGHRAAMPGAGVVRDRRREADQRDGLHRRHRPHFRRADRRARARAFRPASEGHHPDARPVAPDLSQDRRVRAFRPRRARIHLGSHRQGRGAPRSGGPCASPRSPPTD